MTTASDIAAGFTGQIMPVDKIAELFASVVADAKIKYPDKTAAFDGLLEVVQKFDTSFAALGPDAGMFLMSGLAPKILRLLMEPRPAKSAL